MAGDKWLEEYGGQTIDELISLENEYRIDSLLVALVQVLEQKEARVGPEHLSEAERTVQAVEALAVAVNTDGYHGFFCNASEYASIIVEALRHIGCHKTADITQDAIDSLGISGPPAQETIQAVIYDDNDERDQKLDDCDTRFHEPYEDLEKPLFEYVKANRSQIKLN